MAQQTRAGRRYLRAFVSGFFVAVPVTVTVLDRFGCVARVEGVSMQVSRDYTPANQSEGEILSMPEVTGEMKGFLNFRARSAAGTVGAGLRGWSHEAPHTAS